MRNKLAMGQLTKYSPAAKMPCFVGVYMKFQNKNQTFLKNKQQWSEELSFLAELNVRTCKYGHDECRATGEEKISAF